MAMVMRWNLWASAAVCCAVIAPAPGRADPALPVTKPPARPAQPDFRPDWTPEAFVRQLLAMPDGLPALRRLAWWLAVYDDPQVRQPAVAVRLLVAAQRLVEPDAELMAALAAAQAELGSFDTATQTARSAAALARQTADHELLERIEQALAQYAVNVPSRRVGRHRPSRDGDRPTPRRAVAWICEEVAAQFGREGKHSAAVALLQCAAQCDPGYAPPQWKLGRWYFQQRQMTAAAATLAAVCRLQPNHIQAWTLRGQALLALNDEESAAECFRRALALEPDSTTAANNLAWILATTLDSQLRNGDEAIRLAEAACRQTQWQRPELLDTLAAAYAESGRYDDALATIRRAEGLLAERSDPEQPLREALRQHRRLYEARRALRPQAAQWMPDAHADDGTWHLRQAEILYRLGHHDPAAAHLEAALKHQPDDAEMLAKLGRLRVGQQRHEEAVILFARAARAAPGDPLPLMNLGWLLAAGERRCAMADEAVVHAELAAMLDPESWTAWDTLGVAYAACGRFDEAASAADRGWAIATQAGRPLDAAAVARRRELYRQQQPFEEPSAAEPSAAAPPGAMAKALGQLALHQGRLDAAVAHFRRSLAQNPQQPDVLDGLGLAKLQQGDFDQAEHWHRQALALRPDDPNLANNLAWSLVARDQPAAAQATEAARLMEPHCQAAGNKPAGWCDTLAAAYAAAGRMDDAVAVLEELLSASDDLPAPLAALLRRRLDAYRQGNRPSGARLVGLTFHPVYRPWHVREGIRCLKAGRLADARRHLEGALNVQPDPLVLCRLAEVVRRQGEADHARGLLQAVLNLSPKYVPAANNLAWLLATSGDAGDSNAAVHWAEHAAELTAWQQPETLDTLSVAYAAAGRFSEAVEVAQRARQLAVESGRSPLAAVIAEHLEAFQAGRAWSETPP